MKAVGIIAEYNPFHNGHRYHVEETRKLGQADYIIAVMSGDFTQRGEPAIVDKWTRAKMAVQNGVDLVIELPFVFACNNAEFFADGAIRLLEGIGGINRFSFGSESGDLEALMETAHYLAFETEAFREGIKAYLELGDSYPKARYRALLDQKGERMARMIEDSNHILGVEYLKSWIKTGSKMEPMTVKRMGPGYHDQWTVNSFASATGIRNKLKNGVALSDLKAWIPEGTYRELEENSTSLFIDENKLYQLLVYRILLSSTNDLGKILTVKEGLENKAKDAIRRSSNLSELHSLMKSKRYTETRINRLLLHILLNLTKEDFFRFQKEEILYARILGFSNRGADYLRTIKKKELNRIPLLTNVKKEVRPQDPIWDMLQYDQTASNLYHLINEGSYQHLSDSIRTPFVKF